MKDIKPVDNLLLGGADGVEVYASTLKDILLQGQEQFYDHHYVTPYILQGIQAAFKKIIREHKLLFCVKRDIYSPDNVSVRHIVKVFPKCRFAEAYLTIRNGDNIADQKIHDDITYAELLDRSNHTSIHVFKRNH